jgi:hypothetical protein
MPLVDDLKDEFKMFKEMGIRGKSEQLIDLVAGHLHYYRPFQMKNIIQENEINNKQDTESSIFTHAKGVFILFEGYCAIYKKSKHPEEDE